MATKEHWKKEPEDHDFPAAEAYLGLGLPATTVDEVVTALRSAELVQAKAKDLLRASDLALLPPETAHVADDLAKVRKGEHLSPVLLVRGQFARGMPLIVADGYHRICASYHLDENADIPCRIVDLPAK